MKARVLLPVLLVLGAGCTATDPAAEPEAAPTETVTETVEVPGPTETVEVETVPQACLDAIAAAEAMARNAGEFADIAAQNLPLIAEAFEAGATGGSVESILTQLDASDRRLGALNDDVAVVTARFNAAKRDCRTAAR